MKKIYFLIILFSVLTGCYNYRIPEDYQAFEHKWINGNKSITITSGVRTGAFILFEENIVQGNFKSYSRSRYDLCSIDGEFITYWNFLFKKKIIINKAPSQDDAYNTIILDGITYTRGR